MTKEVATLILTTVVLVVGVGGALGALALGSFEMAISILGFTGGALTGQVTPRIVDMLSGRKAQPEEEK